MIRGGHKLRTGPTRIFQKSKKWLLMNTEILDLLAEIRVLFLQKDMHQTQFWFPSRNSLMFGQNGLGHIYHRDRWLYKKTTKIGFYSESY